MIIDPDRPFAGGLALLLGEHGMRVDGIATSAREGIRQAKATYPDIVVMDLILPDMDGFGAGRSILRSLPNVRLLALAAHISKKDVVEAIRSGFRGYVTKKAPSALLLVALRAVMSSYTVVPTNTLPPRDP